MQEICLRNCMQEYFEEVCNSKEIGLLKAFCGTHFKKHVCVHTYRAFQKLAYNLLCELHSHKKPMHLFANEKI